MAEDGDAAVVRLYEAFNAHTRVTVSAGFAFKRAVLCDLLEQETEALPVAGRSVTLAVKPYEIVTIKFER